VLSLQLGFAIIPLIHFTSDKEKMGVFVNKLWVKIAAWVIAIVVVSLNVKLVVNEIASWIENAGGSAWVIWITVIPICVAAGALLLYITFKPWMDRRRFGKKNHLPHGRAAELSNLQTSAYQRIAITIDFSSADTLAIRSAMTQGGKDASYLLVHVVETAGAMWYGSEIADHESGEDARALNDYVNQLKSQGYKVDMKVGFGNPKQVIPEIVNTFGADLLVMGAHGHNWFKDLIFGTTVDTVRHRVKIPVLIVKD